MRGPFDALRGDRHRFPLHRRGPARREPCCRRIRHHRHRRLHAESGPGGARRRAPDRRGDGAGDRLHRRHGVRKGVSGGVRPARHGDHVSRPGGEAPLPRGAHRPRHRGTGQQGDPAGNGREGRGLRHERQVRRGDREVPRGDGEDAGDGPGTDGGALPPRIPVAPRELHLHGLRGIGGGVPHRLGSRAGGDRLGRAPRDLGADRRPRGADRDGPARGPDRRSRRRTRARARRSRTGSGSASSFRTSRSSPARWERRSSPSSAPRRSRRGSVPRAGSRRSGRSPPGCCRSAGRRGSRPPGGSRPPSGSGGPARGRRCRPPERGT